MVKVRTLLAGAHGERRDETRIHAATEQDPDRDVRHQLAAYGIREQLLESSSNVRLGGFLRLIPGQRLGRRPVAPDAALRSAEIEHQRVRRGKFPHALENAVLSRDEPHGQIAIEPSRVDMARPAWVCQQALEFRCESDFVLVSA